MDQATLALLFFASCLGVVSPRFLFLVSAMLFGVAFVVKAIG